MQNSNTRIQKHKSWHHDSEYGFRTSRLKGYETARLQIQTPWHPKIIRPVLEVLNDQCEKLLNHILMLHQFGKLRLQKWQLLRALNLGSYNTKHWKQISNNQSSQEFLVLLLSISGRLWNRKKKKNLEKSHSSCAVIPCNLCKKGV